MSIRIEKILLPIDFSDYGGAATELTCELTSKFDAELRLLHPLETHLASGPNFGMDSTFRHLSVWQGPFDPGAFDAKMATTGMGRARP